MSRDEQINHIRDQIIHYQTARAEAQRALGWLRQTNHFIGSNGEPIRENSAELIEATEREVELVESMRKAYISLLDRIGNG